MSDLKDFIYIYLEIGQLIYRKNTKIEKMGLTFYGKEVRIANVVSAYTYDMCV